MVITKSTVNSSGISFSAWQLWLVVLSGTMVRLLYGYSAQPWLIAPDQLAWQLGLDEMLQSGNWRYVQLVHAPHEGGSALIGLCSLLFSSLKSSLPALSITALLIDTLIRWTQIKIAQQLFGTTTAFWFGCWSIVSIPLLLSWSVVNFGLHYAASVFPFLFFWLFQQYRNHRYLPRILGVCSAIAVSFSYENCLLILPAIWLLLHTEKRYAALFIYLLCFCGCLLPHILLRLSMNGAYISGEALLAGRSGSIVFHPQNLLITWFAAIPASFLLASPSFVAVWIKLVAMLFFIGAGLRRYMAEVQSDWRWICLGFVLLFLLIYSISPFATTSFRESSFTVYRHLAYIVPLLVLLMINGFVSAGRWKNYWLAGWFLCCGIASLVYFNKQYRDKSTAYRAAGWIMVQKYGADMPKLFRLQAVADTSLHHALARGFGWGLAAALLKQEGDNTAVKHLQLLIRQAPYGFQPDLITGVRYAFAPGITPVLPVSQLQKFELQQ